MSDPQVRVIKAVQIIRPEVTIGRPSAGGDLEVRIDGQPIVTIHYIYGWIDNATQHYLAENLAKFFGKIEEPIASPNSPEPTQ